MEGDSLALQQSLTSNGEKSVSSSAATATATTDSSSTAEAASATQQTSEVDDDLVAGMRTELWSEFQACEDQCTIAAQMMDIMAQEEMKKIPESLFDIMEFLDVIRPRLVKLTQEGSMGEIDEESFAKSLEINDHVCALLKQFIKIERALARPNPQRTAAEAAAQLVTSRPSPPPAQNQTLPKAKWKLCHTEEGQPYYYNRETKQSQWEKPPDFDTASADSATRDITAQRQTGLRDSSSASAVRPLVRAHEVHEVNNESKPAASQLMPAIEQQNTQPAVANPASSSAPNEAESLVDSNTNSTDVPPPYQPPPAYKEALNAADLPPAYNEAVSSSGNAVEASVPEAEEGTNSPKQIVDDEFTLDDL